MNAGGLNVGRDPETGMPSSYLKEIGKISVLYSLLESNMSFVICELLGDQNLGQIFTAHLNFTALVDLIGSLYKYKVKDVQKVKKLNGLIAEARAVQEERNKLIHSLHIVEMQTGSMIRIHTTARAKKGLQNLIVQVPIADLRDLTSKISATADRFRELVLQIREARYPEKPVGGEL